MRRPSSAAAIVAVCLAGVLVARASRASDLVFELGVRAGYVFGRGWTIGPAASFVRAGVPSQLLQQKEIALLGGVAVSGDLLIDHGGALDFRLHVGPEIGAVKACPALALTVAGGLVWVFRRGAAVRLGLDAGASLLGSAADNTPSANSDPLFVGVAYRYAGLRGGERGHEVGLDVRLWTLPFNSSPFAWAGLCSTLGGEPTHAAG